MSFATHPSLQGSVVLVTGGASGIGADIVRAFHDQDARVGFVDIRDEPAESLVDECGRDGGGVLYRRCDVRDIPALRQAIGAIATEFGPIRVLINNAADDTREKVEEVTVASWDRSLSVNLRPHFFAAQAVRPGMAAAGGGAIVNLSSITWRVGNPDLAPYIAAKAAIVGLTRALAGDFGEDDIRVNAIEPGAVMTARQRELWYPTEESVDAMVRRQSIRRVLLGEEIARAALFLASEDARMITGQSLVVDAGFG